jgi:hypothetical protein
MAMTLITTNTSSNAASSSFTSSIDSTYKLYIFKLINLNPATDEVRLEVQFQDSSSNNLTKTTTSFTTQHAEDASVAEIFYNTGTDLAQQTIAQPLTETGMGNGSDESLSGTMHLFSPSSTTYVKHFYSKTNGYERRNRAQALHVSGYINSTAAVTQVIFSMNSGNFDGTIKLYGVA